MFVWTSGMHPAFALVFFVVGLILLAGIDVQRGREAAREAA